ncbi:MULTISPECIES: macrolide 2'-phosphotransferase [unclassified Knoellia]|uniref:macrolide 2'-phosphotransferase n=1 Tax=Knoellia altitudinis TaxID=3404795 RepID=UPI0036082D5C
MERTPTFLAALASAGVPGLDPVSVEALPSVPEQDYDVAFVQDTEHRRWVVRAPRNELAAARMDLTVRLLQLLARRLPFTVPAPRGFVELKTGGRAMVYPYIPGHNLAFDALPAGVGPAADLGRAIAALHNTDPRLFDEAGMPSYDTDSYRTRRLADLDRAAESGRVPTALLARWERALEDVALWRFAPTPVHGDLTGDQVLAVFEDDSDASTGRIRGITGWEDAKVADPADDFAALVDEADAATVETVLEAYAHARVERPDANLLVRARLAAELTVLAELMRADARGDEPAIEGLSSRLRRLDESVHEDRETDDYRRNSLTPVALRARTTPPPSLADDDDDEDEVVEFEPAEADTDAPHRAADPAGPSVAAEPDVAVDPGEPAESTAPPRAVEPPNVAESTPSAASPDPAETTDPHDSDESDESDDFDGSDDSDESDDLDGSDDLAESDDRDESDESTPTPQATETTEGNQFAEVDDGSEVREPSATSRLGLDLDFDEPEENPSLDDEVAWTPRTFGSSSRPEHSEDETAEPSLTPEELRREGR